MWGRLALDVVWERSCLGGPLGLHFGPSRLVIGQGFVPLGELLPEQLPLVGRDCILDDLLKLSSGGLGKRRSAPSGLVTHADCCAHRDSVYSTVDLYVYSSSGTLRRIEGFPPNPPDCSCSACLAPSGDKRGSGNAHWHEAATNPNTARERADNVYHPTIHTTHRVGDHECLSVRSRPVTDRGRASSPRGAPHRAVCRGQPGRASPRAASRRDVLR
jgi:hypothetical protein